MRTIYLRKEDDNSVRKILLDMAYLSNHKKIRFPKYKMEDGLYLLAKQKGTDSVEKYFLTKDKIKKEDADFYFFDFPFKAVEVENYSD
ncbi:MAG TPA: hypothetical protein VKA26_13780 [Ignavibacteriaceae bacterium]|nr:hypothetical protein [Ignavibacteriaceae bacterium]